METALENEMAGTYAKISEERSYFLGKYNAIVDDKVKALPEADGEKVGDVSKGAKQGALAKVAIFPAIMLACYIGLIMYFKSRGGYKPVEIGGDGGDH